MSFAEFEASIARDAAPPPGTRMALQGLWHDARGDWARAHRCVQDDADGPGAWVHAYLHRKEGDTGNAAYWYARARQTPPPDEVTFDKEWKQIARALTKG
jgi:hypothetical protein